MEIDDEIEASFFAVNTSDINIEDFKLEQEVFNDLSSSEPSNAITSVQPYKQ